MTQASRSFLAKVPRPLRLGAGIALPVAVGVAIWHGVWNDPHDGLGPGVAILIAGLVIGLALSLPGRTPEGLLLGIGIPFAAMMAWTRLDQPRYIWAVQIVLGLIALVWTFPWWWKARDILRLGGFWLAVPIWLLGTVSAVLMSAWRVGAQRIVYAGYALLILLLLYQAARKRGRDISVGLVAGFMLCHAALVVAGNQYVFATGIEYHYTSPSAWGFGQADRFWGGPWLVYHPNFIGLTAVIVALRIGPDAAFKAWQRIGVVATTLFLLFIVESRTSFLVAGVGAVTYGLLVLWRAGMPRWRFWTWFAGRDRRRLVMRATAPLIALIIVFGAAGGQKFLLKARYEAPNATAEEPAEEPRIGAMLSGRADIWAMVLREFSRDGIVEKTFGTADNPRGYLLRYKDPNDERYAEQPKLTADNMPIGALRRGGILGLAAVILGTLLVLWRTLRARAPLWVPVSVLGVLTSAVAEDDVAGTSPQWLMLFAAELYMVYLIRRRADEPDQPVREAAHATH